MGTQGCTAIAPDVFRLGLAGTSTVIRTRFTAKDLSALREAEEYCPFSAIRVEVLEGGRLVTGSSGRKQDGRGKAAP